MPWVREDYPLLAALLVAHPLSRLAAVSIMACWTGTATTVEVGTGGPPVGCGQAGIATLAGARCPAAVAGSSGQHWVWPPWWW